ncbi:MAG: DedA family protein [Cellulomonadaceae bacterium]|jgi:membrane protein DedA with SNARE-associated domain|nr:DedA family protein [Cellulomonadaceae bacterium]
MSAEVLVIIDQFQTWILGVAGAWYVYPSVLFLAFMDGFFPPLPSESVITALAVAWHSQGRPWLWLLLIVAAVGAWCGDQVAYTIGQRIGTDRVPPLRTAKGRATVAWAQRALARRGTSFIIAARYIPLGRIAVNMTAGALGYPRKRFMLVSGIAAPMWALNASLIGFAAGAWLADHPLVAMAAGIVAGTLVGFIVDPIVQLITKKGDGTDESDRRSQFSEPDPLD